MHSSFGEKCEKHVQHIHSNDALCATQTQRHSIYITIYNSYSNKSTVPHKQDGSNANMTFM